MKFRTWQKPSDRDCFVAIFIEDWGENSPSSYTMLAVLSLPAYYIFLKGSISPLGLC